MKLDCLLQENRSMHMLIPSPHLFLPPPFPFGNHKFVFYVCGSIFVFQVSSFVPFFLIPLVSNIIYLSFSGLWVNICIPLYLGFSDGSLCKESACHAGDTGNMGSVPGLGRSPGEGHGDLLQCSCLENPMDKGAGKLQSKESQRVGHHTHTHTHTHYCI